MDLAKVLVVRDVFITEHHPTVRTLSSARLVHIVIPMRSVILYESLEAFSAASVPAGKKHRWIWRVIKTDGAIKAVFHVPKTSDHMFGQLTGAVQECFLVDMFSRGLRIQILDQVRMTADLAQAQQLDEDLEVVEADLPIKVFGHGGRCILLDGCVYVFLMSAEDDLVAMLMLRGYVADGSAVQNSSLFPPKHHRLEQTLDHSHGFVLCTFVPGNALAGVDYCKHVIEKGKPT
jgi:hypothetical protein